MPLGEYEVEQRIGRVADLCPVCRKVAVFDLSRIFRKRLFGIPFIGSWLHATAIDCTACGGRTVLGREAFPDVMSFSAAEGRSLDDILAATNRRLARQLAERKLPAEPTVCGPPDAIQPLAASGPTGSPAGSPTGNRNRIVRIREWLAQTEAGDHPRLGQMRTRLRRIEELEPSAQSALLDEIESILDEIDHRNDIDELLCWTGRKLHAIQWLQLPYLVPTIGGIFVFLFGSVCLESAKQNRIHVSEDVAMIAFFGWLSFCAAGFLLVIFADLAYRKRQRQRVFRDELLPEAERRGFDIDDVIRRIEEIVNGGRGTAALRLVASFLPLLLDVLDEEDSPNEPSVS